MITVRTTVDSTLKSVWEAYTTPKDIQRWNFASDDWHCPSAANDLRDGGAFCYRMEAKDGSMGFDFEGVFTRVSPSDRLEYMMGDRKAVVVFKESAGGIVVSVSFGSDGAAPKDMQRAGWQAILDNFKRHVESTS